MATGRWSNNVLVNDEVRIELEVKPSGNDLVPGQPVFLNEIEAESARLKAPIIDGRSASYLLMFRTFMDLFISFDFAPIDPARAGSPLPSRPFPVAALAYRERLLAEHPPQDVLVLLKESGWPPSPACYPEVVDALFSTPSADRASEVANRIVGLFGEDYWNRRLALWQELKLFPERFPYVSKAVQEYLAGDYISSIYVLVPQFEGLINSYVQRATGRGHLKFRAAVDEFRRIITGRKALLFPKYVLDSVLEYVYSGSFWRDTSTIVDTQMEVNRHGIAHGVFTGFQNQHLALKFILLIDCLAFILLQDNLICGTL